VRAILLDAYGTLFHYERVLLHPVFERVVRDQGLHVDPSDLFDRWGVHEAEFRSSRLHRDERGNWHQEEPFRSYTAAWTQCFRGAFRDSGEAGADAEAATDTLIRDLMTRRMFTETTAAIEALQARVPVSILSNADDRFLLGTLAHNGLDFEIVVSSEGERVYKPHPLLFERALDRIGAEAPEVIYAGDSPLEDIVGATGAGMPSVWINRDGSDWPLSDEERPTHEVPDLLGLIDIVNSRGSGAFF
jgi:2-haloalkanoic acid dehalogenase type II